MSLSSHLRFRSRVTLLGALVAVLFLSGCVAGDRGYYGSGGGYRGDSWYDDGPYYGRQDVYRTVPRPPSRLERHQKAETRQLERENDRERRGLLREQAAERERLKAAGEWDKADKRDQKQERRAENRSGKEEERELRQHQREEREDYRPHW